MANIKEEVNRYFATTEPWKLIAGTFGTTAGLYLLARIGSNYEEFKNQVQATVIKTARALPMANDLIKGKTDELMVKLEGDMHGHKDIQKMLTLPTNGMPRNEILDLMRLMKDREENVWKSGRVSGGIYVGDDEHIKFLNEAYSMYSITNPLHPDVFPSVRKFEAEVVRMTASILHADELAAGAMTSGGTESILMALKTYRDYARLHRPSVTVPEIIVPTTVHAAFDKGCQYFNMKLVSIPLTKDFVVDVDRVRKAINRNTILIVGSAPNFPHGLVDPIEELAAIATEHKLALHVDCCLGGFVLPFLQKLGYQIPVFDFRIPAVTSISIDTHKYGQAPKGSSVIIYRTAELRKFMYFATTEWPGGMYASPTMAGSRPGALSAGTWAAMLAFGEKGYLDQARLIGTQTKILVDGLKAIPELQVIGDPKGPVVAWTSNKFDIYRLSDFLAHKGWKLNALHKPACLHIAFTSRHTPEVVQSLLHDIQEGVKVCLSTPASKEGMAPVYGMAATLPDRGLIKDILYSVVDVMLKA